VQRLIAHVGAAGPACKAFTHGLEAERGALALRPLLGLCDLLKRHGNERLERVCALALSAGTFRLRFLRAAAARNVSFTIFALMVCAICAVLVSGIYRQFFQGTSAAGEFFVDAVLALVSVDLVPLGLRFDTLRCEAVETRVMLSSLP
jgi:hypothetical protein